MNFLPNNFTVDRYGLHVRFVTESDASFIMAIRTNSKNLRFINNTKDDLKSQIEYLRNYKKWEKLGKEYYFIFECDGTPQGVYRIYNRCEDWCTTGSWVFSPSAERFAAIKAFVITHEIVFNNLDYTYVKSNDGVNIRNVNVIRFINNIGAEFDTSYRTDGTEEYVTFLIKRDIFIEKRKNVLRFCGY